MTNAISAMRYLPAFTLFAICGCSTSHDFDHHSSHVISFPSIGMKKHAGERIDSLEVVVKCGRFVAINRIPNDWSAEVVSPSSEVTTLRMSAGHGSSALWSSKDLDRVVTVMNCDDACFDITAKVTTFYWDEGTNATLEREHLFDRSQLIFLPSATFCSRPGVSGSGP
jgi:hypothetical protein